MTDQATWFVYMLQCADGTFYTGITTDLQRRLKEHNAAKTGAKYTRVRRPVDLVFQQEVADRSSAAKYEYQIKQLSRSEKLKLIKQNVSEQ
jgi:putative endonuclease